MVDQHVETPAAAVEHPVLDGGVLGAAKLPPSGPPANEGKTVAAWTTVVIVLVGAVVAAVGVAAGLHWLAWVGGAIIVVGIVVGGVMRSLGHGQPQRRAAR